MKKILSIVIPLILVLSLCLAMVSCGGNNNGGKPNNGEPNDGGTNNGGTNDGGTNGGGTNGGNNVDTGDDWDGGLNTDGGPIELPIVPWTPD